MALRDGLGGSGRPLGFLPEHKLSLHDLDELIRRVGWEAGFIAETEWRVAGPSPRSIDWVWLDPGQPIVPFVAFEIEGPAVPFESIANDEVRFTSAGAVIEIIALYRVDHNRTVRTPADVPPVRCVETVLRHQSVLVYLNVELMSLGAPGAPE